MSSDPQNPYRSCVVRASAGSGKTYQLSQRFLCLVAAGAHPSTILTVTFTRKAAAEMRERILESASHLLKDQQTRASFDEKMQLFYLATSAQKDRPSPPKSAQATGAAILAATQSLRISTIDSILLEWLRKFPYEAGGQGSWTVPSPFDLINSREQKIFHRKAWFETVKELKENPKLFELWNSQEPFDLLELEQRIEELVKHKSFLWLTRQLKSVEESLLVHHPLPNPLPGLDAISFLQEVKPELSRILNLLSGPKALEARAALEAFDMNTLQELRILTKTWDIHGGTFRKPKRDAVENEIDSVHTVARLRKAYAARKSLNSLGHLLVALYEIYEQKIHSLKLRDGKLEFGDLIKGSYHIFQNPDAAGVRYLLHKSIRHLLLDEFQDTSILQWTMFRSMCEEMLSGQGLEAESALTPSVFIVGDPKQSIYGFREAEAEILDEAASYLLERQAHDIQLNASYRTAPTILALVNAVFTHIWPHFPQHAAATKQGQSAVLGLASFSIGPLFEQTEDEDVIEAEANYLARKLRHWLENPETPKLWDKKASEWRRPHPGDCAILYRNSTHADTYAKALRTSGFAVRIEEGQSFFDRPEIQDLWAFCKWMTFPSHTEAFVQVLKSPLVRISDQNILAALMQTSDRQAFRTSRHHRILAHLKALTPEKAQLLSHWQKLRSHLSPYQLLIQAFHQGAWFQAYEMAFGEEGPLAAANLRRFLEWVADGEIQGRQDWISLWQAMEQAFEDKSIALASQSDQAVQLMTIHKAKGLEFPLVILAGAGEEWERTDKYWAKMKGHPHASGVAYIGRKQDRAEHDTHFEDLENNQLALSHQENLRLLYVALTRAQYHLWVTGHKRKRGGSGFFETIRDSARDLGAAPKIYDSVEVLEFRDPDMTVPSSSEAKTETKRPHISGFKERDIGKALASPLGSIKILAPARLLQEAEETRFKSSRNAIFAREYGVFVHLGLEYELKQKPSPDLSAWMELCPADVSLTVFEEHFATAQALLQKALTSQQWSELCKRAVQHWPELPIAFLQGQSLVRGTIDLLLKFSEDEFLVLDYKTVADLPPDTQLPAYIQERRYDQQLSLYQEGVQRLYPDAKVGTAIFFTDRDVFVFLQKTPSLC